MAVIPFVTQIDFMNPRWNRDAWARIQADLDSDKQRFCHCSGQIMAVRPGEAVKPILGFQTFLATRLLPLPDGNIRRVNKEVIFYTNLTRLGQPGEIIDSWQNPFTNETVRVVHAINDPFNYTISDMLILAPEDFPGDKSKLPKIPLIFPWQEIDADTLAARITPSGILSLEDLDDLNIGTVGSLTGLNIAGERFARIKRGCYPLR